MPSSGTVRFWRAEEGWEVIDSADTPGGCWVIFDTLWKTQQPELDVGETREVSKGYRALSAAEQVDFTWERPPGGQDGYEYRATAVWPRRPSPDSANS
jgi:hypothetical protein